MGAAHSGKERSVSIDNPNPPPTGIIDISDEVVQRLKQNIKQQQQQAKEKNTASSAANSKEAPPKAKPEPAASAPPSAAPPQPKPKPPTVPQIRQVPVATKPVPQVVYMASPEEANMTITATDVLRQTQQQWSANEEKWRERMVNLEKSIGKSNDIMEAEFTASYENIKSRFAQAAPQHQLPPGQDLKAQLIACYRAHPGETLMCSEEVAKFRNCIAEHRVKRLDAAKAA